MGRPSLGGISAPARLSLSSRGRGNRSRVGIDVGVRRRLRDRRGRQWGDGGTIGRAGGNLKRHCHEEAAINGG